MSKLQIPKKIRIEDFEKQYQDLISRLGYSINSFYDDVSFVLNNNVDFDNLNRNVVTVDVTVDGSGAVVNSPQVKYTLRSGKITGLNVINAQNLSSPGVPPTSAPWVTYSFSNGLMTVLSVSGVQPSSTYRLTLELIG